MFQLFLQNTSGNVKYLETYHHIQPNKMSLFNVGEISALQYNVHCNSQNKIKAKKSKNILKYIKMIIQYFHCEMEESPTLNRPQEIQFCN